MISGNLWMILGAMMAVVMIVWWTPVTEADFQRCTPAYCLAHPCAKMSCKGKNKFLMHNVTKCGCCDQCIEQLDEDSDCITEMHGHIPEWQCGPHLKCHLKSITEATCKKISDIETEGCEYERKKIESDRVQMVTGQQPECDEFGDYSLRQCKNGTLCQCITTYRDSRTGKIRTKPIFGTSIYTKQDKMNCLCSNQFWNTNQKLHLLTHIDDGDDNLKSNDFNGIPDTEFDIEPIHFLRCKPNGNFEPFQYYGNYTYCIDEHLGQVEERPVRFEHAKELPCYKHRYTFQTPCIKEYNKAVERYDSLRKDGFEVIGFDLPRCDLDGSYAPVQCQNDMCYCVDRDGKQYSKTMVDRRDKIFAAAQKCSCVRNMELIRDIPEKKRNKITELFSHYQCDINGNYLPLQCSNTECYCVDPITGLADYSDQPRTAFKTELNELRKLFCYVNYPDGEGKRRLDRKIQE